MQNLVFCFIKLRSFCVVTSQVRCILWCHSWCRRSVQSLSYVSCSAAAARNRTLPLSNIQTQYFRDSPIFLSLLIYVILKVVSWSSITEYVLIQTSRDEGWITFQVYFYEGNNNNWTDISQTVVLNICWNQVVDSGGKNIPFILTNSSRLRRCLRFRRCQVVWRCRTPIWPPTCSGVTVIAVRRSPRPAGSCSWSKELTTRRWIIVTGILCDSLF